MREAEAHLDETWSSWIAGHAPSDVFDYRVRSPVVIAELDHHCGVFLDYDTPKPFHVHTVLRTPHGNDYGRAWVRQWQERGGRGADPTALGPPERRDLLGRQRPRPPAVQQQVDAGGLLQFLDGIGGRREVGGRDDRPVVGQQHGV
jgi:hypothetical protein